jgi:hypothetical protein
MSGFNIFLWMSALLFVAAIYNAASAYTALGHMDVQMKFQEIGLLDDGKPDFLIPPRKPAFIGELASSE